MRELRTLVIVLVMSFLFNGLIPVAFADEKPSAFQTELTDTTVSGYVSASADLPFPTDSDALAPADMSASFSPSSVPEPSAISLFAVGILAFVVFARSTRCGCKSRMATQLLLFEGDFWEGVLLPSVVASALDRWLAGGRCWPSQIASALRGRAARDD
jgi:hypothetical protein